MKNKGLYMNYRGCVLSLFRPGVVLLFIAGAVSLASAQYPPAVGPDSYKTGTFGVPVFGFPDVAKGMIQGILDKTNADFKAKGKNYVVSLAGNPTFTGAPYRLATQNKNTPNQFYVTVPMSFTVDVNIPTYADRQLIYPLNVNLVCEGWSTGKGMVMATAVPGPPTLNGGSIFESLLTIRDNIDLRIIDSLPAIGPQMVPLDTNTNCVTIGAARTNGSTADLKNASVNWDPPPTSRPIIGKSGAHVVVTFETLKRLTIPAQAHAAAVETFRLDTYANFERNRSISLSMREGDVVPLKMTPTVINSPLPSLLVVIADIDQSVVDVDATAFSSAPKTANYSPGEHTMQIPVRYLITNRQGKPTSGHTPGYELTYRVDLVSEATIGQPGKAH